MSDRVGMLKYAPLTYVLASVRFAPWPLMAKKIDEIHDELRDILPLIHRIQIRQIGLDGQVSTQGEGTTPPSVWMLIPSDRLYGVQLAPDQLLVLCKKYTRYVDFEDIFGKVLDVLFKHMRTIIDVTSMGVRYVDHIKIKPEEELKKYINGDFLPSDISGLEKIGGIVLGTYKSNDAELRIRCISQPDTWSVPEDLIQVLAMTHEPNTPLKLEPLKIGEMLFDIDSLMSYASPKRMQKDGIINQLKSLHQEANAFFRHESVFTDHAFNVWQGDS